MVGTTADFRRFGPQRSLPLNDLPSENRGTAGRIGEVGLATDTLSDDPQFVKGVAGEIRDFLHSPLGAASAAAAQLRLGAEMALGQVPPGTRTDPGGILIELLPLRIRDHMPDRYCRALQ